MIFVVIAVIAIISLLQLLGWALIADGVVYPRNKYFGLTILIFAFLVPIIVAPIIVVIKFKYLFVAAYQEITALSRKK